MLLNDLRITIIQTEIIWENKQENLRSLRSKLEKLCGETDLIVLPEMFSTGFSMRSDVLSESIMGMTITTLQQWASEFNLAIAGSYIACENTSYFNRAFFITPEGDSVFYDKRHLSVWEVKLKLLPPEIKKVLFIIGAGIFVCWFVTTYVFRYGAET